MDDQKQQIIDRLKQANNILVTVKSDPSIDQLAACIGLTLILNELNKHATAVFSGQVPSVLEFLEPEKTLETNTDSLRDFIISLDKSKADKLRYKVEDKVVKIFITPYKTSISDSDLEFSQGDFNVDVVIALGVHNQDELDQAITNHGRILHDATVLSINTSQGENLGTVNWQDTTVSSLSEMIASVADSLGGKKAALDTQTATALLTGIVAETERFSNSKTTPQTMSVSAKLLTAGANQELVASKLSEPQSAADDGVGNDDSQDGTSIVNVDAPPKPDDGTLAIDHTHDEPPEVERQKEERKPEPVQDQVALPPIPAPDDHQMPPVVSTTPALSPEEREEKAALDLLKGRQIKIDEQGKLQPISHEHREFLEGQEPILGVAPEVPDEEEKPAGLPFDDTKFALTPPMMGGTLTANSRPQDLEPSTDPLSSHPLDQPILSHETPGLNIDSEKEDSPTHQSSIPYQVPTPPASDLSSMVSTSLERPNAGSDVVPPVPAPTSSQPAVEPLSIAATVPPVVSTSNTPSTESYSTAAPEPPKPELLSTSTEADTNTEGGKTLEEIEEEVHSPHASANADDARAAIEAIHNTEPPILTDTQALNQAVNSVPTPEAEPPMPPVVQMPFEEHPQLQATMQDASDTKVSEGSAEDAFVDEAQKTPAGPLEAQPLSKEEVREQSTPQESESVQPAKGVQESDQNVEAQTLNMPLPPAINVPPAMTVPPTSSMVDSPAAPPPVPPPMMPFGPPSTQ